MRVTALSIDQTFLKDIMFMKTVDIKGFHVKQFQVDNSFIMLDPLDEDEFDDDEDEVQGAD